MTLDAALADALAALPNHDDQRDHPLWKYGHWRMSVVGPWDIEYNGHRPTWQAFAHPYNAGMSGDDLDRDIEALGPDPATALRALAAKLRSFET